MNNPILLLDPDGRDWLISSYVDSQGVIHFSVLFTGTVVNASSNKNINTEKFAAAIQKQFNDLFNKTPDDQSYTVDARAIINTRDDESEVEEGFTP
ncbi:hypothetical protein [Mucilaginibacter sp. SJ]|uniref:hypothetical protein n=1 Tax=Mucilaginibacter sp. SJ TaxID=3029053 RepID=UPI0023A9147D|nr:hypothetical protein [Mucilaginibacter sp. SJ]WEA00660.1 hypothetical protein MusilaSJ_24705 [Mucilaginibacter sp. SJ]